MQAAKAPTPPGNRVLAQPQSEEEPQGPVPPPVRVALYKEGLWGGPMLLTNRHQCHQHPPPQPSMLSLPGALGQSPRWLLWAPRQYRIQGQMSSGVIREE